MTPRPFGVYVHFPYCAHRCPYCDFASAAIARDSVPHERCTDAVLRELDARAPELTKHKLVSVFFGGGTPSLWKPTELGRLLARVRSSFGLETTDIEITVECEPVVVL